MLTRGKLFYFGKSKNLKKKVTKNVRKVDMFGLRMVIFLIFLRFGANFAETFVLGYLWMISA